MVSFLSKSQGVPVQGDGSNGFSMLQETKIEGKRGEEYQEDASSSDMDDICRQREAIIAEARQEARKIKENAYQEGFAQGLAEGRNTGHAEGRKEAWSTFLPLEDTLRNLIEQIEQVQEDILNKQEQEILDLCIKMAQKIIHTEISQNPKLILANLREGLKSIGHHKVTAIRLNPRDLELIRDMRESISQSILNLEGVALEGDPGILAGGCLIQTELGYVDATMETQIQELEKTFSLSDDGAASSTDDEGLAEAGKAMPFTAIDGLTDDNGAAPPMNTDEAPNTDKAPLSTVFDGGESR